MPLIDAENLARELLSAQQTDQMVPVLPSARPGFDLDAAYAVEAALRRAREAAGHRTVGRKVGYANKAMWRVLKLETLVWAHMYDNTVHYSDNNSTALTLPHRRSRDCFRSETPDHCGRPWSCRRARSDGMAGNGIRNHRLSFSRMEVPAQ